MNSKRSYLDTLNAGRQRRPHATLEQLNRSLEVLERRLGDRDVRESQPMPAQRPESDASSAGRRAYDRPLHEASPISPYARAQVAPVAEPVRRSPDEAASLDRVTGEIRTLREDLRQLMSTGVRREFELLRKEMEASYAAGEGKTANRLGAEFERLSGAIQSLADRSDDHVLEALRQEIGRMRGAVEARAETAPVWFGRRIDDFEERLTVGLSQRPTSDPQVAMLGRRLDEIAGVLAALPDSRVVRALEDNMRSLAEAVDRLAGQQGGRSEAAFGQIDERLNEISRAIVAATIAAQSPHIDPEPFRRIEARVADLAVQIDELSGQRQDDEVARRLDHISDRIEHVAESAALPGLAFDRLAGRIAEIAEAIERAPRALDEDRMMAGLEDHLHRVSVLLADGRDEAQRQNGAMMHEIEQRIDSIVARIDRNRNEMLAGSDSRMGSIEAHIADLAGRLETLRADPAVGLEALRGVEARMQQVAERFDLFSERYSAFDPGMINGLERQVAELADRLAAPNAAMRDIEYVGRRLEEVEHAIAASRDALFDAARDAAEAATRSLMASTQAPAESPVIAALVQDLKGMETLTRRSDERNGKTFEAIHDTLLKIVDRLAVMERAPVPQPLRESTDGKLRIEKTPAFDVEPVSLADALPAHDAVDTEMERATRSPSQAAADAALAALGETEAEIETEPRPRSLFGGLSRVLGRKPQAKPELATPAAPVAKPVDVQPADAQETVDPVIANRPLEPGSGAPDLNAIMKRVREERGQVAAAPAGDSAKSDFIAAARRAAQAAAADSHTQKRKAEVGGPVKALRIGDLLKARRKPLLMATAAVTLGIAGMQLGKAFFNDPVAVTGYDMPPALEEPAGSSSLVAAIQPQEEDAAVEAASRDDEGAVPEEITGLESDFETDEDPGITGATTLPQIPSMPSAVTPSSEISVAAFSPVQPAAASVPASIPVPSAADSIPAEVGPAALREAAAGGDPKAMFEIGSRFAEGAGVKADMAEAAEWYRKAAGLGFALAQYRIGSFYEKGLGVERNAEKAKSWYGMAAEKGNANAMHNLAVLYAMDAKSDADNQAAARWFLAAAELGVRDSQFNLGILAAKGVGMKQNLEEGYKWFALVAKAGDKDASAKRDEIAKALRPEQLQRARAAAELWKPKPLDPASNSVEIPQAWQGEATVAEVDMKKAVQNIQLILAKNGYDAGQPDGMMGARTKNAIKAFQKDNGMSPSGEIDETLVNALLARK